MKLFISLLALLTTASVFAQDIELPTIDTQLKDGIDSIVLEEESHVDVTNPKKVIFSYRRLITVYNASGNSDVLAYANYSNTSRVKKISATVYNETGYEVKSFKKNDFKDVSAVSDISIYEDDRTLYLSYVPTSYPYTVEFEKQVETESSGFLPLWLPVKGVNTKTLQSLYTISYSADNELYYNTSNFEDSNITFTETPTSKTWQGKDFKIYNREALAVNFLERVPVVKAALKEFYLEGVKGTAASWKAFGNWMNTDLIAQSNNLSSETIKEIKTLIAPFETKEEKARAIYDYVQNKVRYISIQIEIGGWKPMLSSDVHRLNYGDCKALTNYTQNLMSIADISSYYTLVFAGEEPRDINSDIIALQGNHAILALDLNNDINDLTWLECTSQQTPFGYLGDFTDNRQVLLITDDNSQFVKTKEYRLDENLKLTTANWEINDSGDLTGTSKTVSTGISYGARYGLETLNQDQLQNYYLKTWGHLNNASINDINFTNNKKDIVFTEDIDLTIPNYSQSIGDDLLLEPNIFSKTDIPLRYPNRQSDFEIHRSTKTIETHNFTIPEGFTINTLPEPITIQTKFGNYQATFKIEANKLIYTRTVIVSKGRFTAEDYKAYRTYLKKISKQDSKKLILSKQKT